MPRLRDLWSQRKAIKALEALLDSYEIVADTQNVIQGDVSTEDYYFDPLSGDIVTTPVLILGSVFKPIYFDPAKYAVPGRTTVCRISAATPGVVNGDFIPGVGLDLKLLEVVVDPDTGEYSAGDQVGEVASLVTAIGARGESAEFELPAGWYLFGVRADADDVNTDCQVALEVRRV